MVSQLIQRTILRKKVKNRNVDIKKEHLQNKYSRRKADKNIARAKLKKELQTVWSKLGLLQKRCQK